MHVTVGTLGNRHSSSRRDRMPTDLGGRASIRSTHSWLSSNSTVVQSTPSAAYTSCSSLNRCLNLATGHQTQLAVDPSGSSPFCQHCDKCRLTTHDGAMQHAEGGKRVSATNFNSDLLAELLLRYGMQAGHLLNCCCKRSLA